MSRRCLWLLLCVTSCMVGVFGHRNRENVKPTDKPTINIEFIVETKGAELINETAGTFTDDANSHTVSGTQSTVSVGYQDISEALLSIQTTPRDRNVTPVSEVLPGLSQTPPSTQTKPRARYRDHNAKLLSEVFPSLLQAQHSTQTTPRDRNAGNNVKLVSEVLSDLSEPLPLTLTTPRASFQDNNVKLVSELFPGFLQAPHSTQTVPRARNQESKAKLMPELVSGFPGLIQAPPSTQTTPHARKHDGNTKRGDRWYLHPNFHRHGGKNYVYSNRRYQNNYRVNGRWWYNREGKTRTSMGKFRPNRY